MQAFRPVFTYFLNLSRRASLSRLGAVLLVLAGLGFFELPAQGGSILREVFRGIGGTDISDLVNSPNYPDNPTSVNEVTNLFESPTNVFDDYGQRMHGFIIPPVSGNYTFWIASDDGGQLWLSDSQDPAGADLIAYVAGWTSSRQWNREANQQSSPVSLVAGQAYYISALMKEGGGGDNLAVRWRRPDGVDQGPIPANYLLPWGIAFEPPVITSEPADTTAVEGQFATFEVGVSATTPAQILWRRNGADLGSTSPSLVYGPVTMADQGARFQAVLTNSEGTTISREATLTVTPDVTRPTLAAALNLGRTQLRVTFSEPVADASALQAGNYGLDGGLTVSAAARGADARTVLLTTPPMIYGTSYTLTVSGVQDQAAVPNTILPGSELVFTAVEYAPRDVGDPSISGDSVPVPGGFDVTGSGSEIGRDSDQFQYGYQLVTGDFDLAARVEGLTISDAFAQAGLMARESLDGDARFAGVFASSAQLGCFFQSRSGTGAQAAMTSIRGEYPVNYPNTWLRLRRVGNAFYGFASQDGSTWTQLGSITLSGMPSELYFGFAVTSDDAETSATARFRNVGPPPGTAAGNPVVRGEPIGPASRSTGLAISEVMYHPADRADGKNLEFLEIYNGRAVAEELTGWRISGAIDFVFPDGYTLPAGGYAVIAADPAAMQAVYGLGEVLGPYTGNLPNDGGRIRLRNNADALRLELNYADNPRWPVAADGAGHALVLARPSWGQDALRAWEAGATMGGSPGQMEAVVLGPTREVVINEFLAHTDLPLLDMVELFNAGPAPADISGCWLTDDPSAAADPAAVNRYRIPDGTILQPGAFVSFDETELGFSLRSGGDEILLVDPDTTRVIDGFRFTGQENGVASGRAPDGGPTVRRLAAPTPAAPNTARRVEDVVISEIMYHPISDDGDDEFVEIHNRTGSAVDLAGWELGGGIDFRIPEPTILPANGYLVVGRNTQRLLANHPHLAADDVRGDYQGSLGDGGDRVSLRKPDWVVSTNDVGAVVTNRIEITVVEVTYADGGRWGELADGGGSSLELVDPQADPQQAANWRDSDETQKAAWQTVSGRARLDNGNTDFSADRIKLGMLGPGECLVDEIELYEDGGGNLVANGGFESGSSGWSLQGNHSTSTVDATGAAVGSRCLHVRGTGDTDPGINSIRRTLGGGLSNGEMVNFRARVRWLGGWPEVLFRVRGNYAEFPIRMNVPASLGTPGLPNSRLVSNSGPAIFDVTHAPPVPQAGEGVTITCRVEDRSGIGGVQLRYRVDPSTTSSTVLMRDDGIGSDIRAGDGVYTGQLGGRSSGSLVAFRIEATDGARAPAGSVFPEGYPNQECLVRWGDTIPFGTFTHYHMWNTAATESARNSTPGLDNTWFDATLVYNNDRVIYNVKFRDKGSPYHGGRGDFAVTVPPDDILLGAKDRVFASTGNGNSEATGIRSQLSAWLAQQLEIPYLHAQYMQLYRNGSQFRNISEDLQQPNHDYAESWFPTGGEGDLYKVAIWFEFQDDNTSFSRTDATLQRFATLNNELKLARYRWNFQRRSNDGRASNYANLFDLVETINDTSGTFVPNLLNLADIDQWMRAFGFSRITGNWDVWSDNVGQNMYAFKQPGDRWKLMPWDIDFTFGLGDGAGAGLWGGQDPVINRVYNTPTFRRMLWQCFLDAAEGPMLPANYQPQIDRRAEVLRKNGVSVSSPDSIGSYIDQRRAYILNRVNQEQTAQFAITSNNGNNFTSAQQSVTLSGTAPFAVAALDINGIPYVPVWTGHGTYQVTVPLDEAVNVLQITGIDRHGHVIPGLSDSITVTYSGAIQTPEDYVVINEVHYHPLEADAGFVELYNRSTTTGFDLSGYRLDGVGYVFPDGSILPPNDYLILASDRAGFGTAYGAAIPIFDEFPGRLSNGGESLALVRPGATPETDVLICDLRYDDQLPWPTNADGWGPSLQLLDPARSTWRLANWGAAAIGGRGDQTTPGSVNTLREDLAPFPDLWINEIQPSNTTGPTDGAGEREPWIEIYNGGSEAVDLSGLYLTDDYADLTKWGFPAGASVDAGGFLLVWADGEPAESSPEAPHTSFRLPAASGSVALVRMQGSPAGPAVLDYVDYELLTPDRTVGAVPDGDPRRRRLLHVPTPWAPNDPSSPVIQVFINEVLADNTFVLADPADDDYEDWFELYNAGGEGVDLTAYSLTDDLTEPDKYVVPPGYVIPPGGFLLVWADEEPNQNSPTLLDLHADFKLSAAGEEVGLFAPDGSLVDAVTFGAQTADESVGREPDGGGLPLYAQPSPSPRLPNFQDGGNLVPVLDPIGPKDAVESVPLIFQATGSDPDAGQSVVFSLDPGAPAGASIDADTGHFAWTPTETDGPGTYFVTVRIIDNGIPVRSSSERITIQVAEVNRAPVLSAVADQEIDEGSTLQFILDATDPDSPENNLFYSLDPGAPDGADLDPDTGVFAWTPTEAQGQGTYPVTVRVTDDGSPPMSHAGTFEVTVNEVSNPPIMPLIQAQAVDEEMPFRLTVVAEDPDNPPSPLLFSLETAPPGAEIDPQSGEITWTPTEAQGPENAIFVVRVTETVPPNLSAGRTFSVAVAEVNQPPAMQALLPITVRQGEVAVVQATALDADLPAQGLTFSLEPGAPAGATVDPVSGLFVWATDPDAPLGIHPVTIRVVDNGPGTLSDAASFSVTVETGFHAVINEIMYNSVDPHAAYIEIHNPSMQSEQVLDSLELRGTGLQYTFPPETTLSTGAYLCVVADGVGFEAAYGDLLPVSGAWNGVLSAPDTIQLIQPGVGGQPDLVLDSVTFDRSGSWPTGADGSGASLQLVDPGRDNDRAGNWVAATEYSGNESLVEMTRVWRYYQEGEVDADWRTYDFDDSAWPEGGGLLYAGSAELPGPKTTPLNLGEYTYYFRVRFAAPNVPADALLVLNHVIDDGAVFWLNGQEIHRFNMSDGEPAHVTLTPTAVNTAEIQGPITIPVDALLPGANVLAVEVHQIDRLSRDVAMGCSLDAEGGTLAPATPGAPNNISVSLDPFPTLRINEVQTRNLTGPTDRFGEREPWIEIVNTGPAPVSLDSLYLSDNPDALTAWAFPAGLTIPSGGFLVVVADGEPGESSPEEVHTSFRLPTDPDSSWWVALARMQGNVPAVIDALGGTVPTLEGSTGRYPDGNPASVTNFAEATPGAVNSGALVPMIVESDLRADGQPGFSWTALAGRDYRVEYKTDLDDTPWSILVTVRAGQVLVDHKDTAAAGAPRRFYRIVLLP